MTEGDRVGRLTILRCVGIKRHRRVWECKCDCGKIVNVRQDCLSRRVTTSCGCRMLENQHQQLARRTKHGMHNTRIYRIWVGIKSRCNSPKATGYADYGGRGITMCSEWANDFMAFYHWAMENGYSDDLSIDRIDVNGNYEPTNCRWATNSEQRSNQRQITLTFNGQTHTVGEWASITGINYCTLLYRLRKGYSADKILSPPQSPAPSAQSNFITNGR